MNRFMYLFLAIQEIVSKATCESNKDTNKQTNKWKEPTTKWNVRPEALPLQSLDRKA